MPYFASVGSRLELLVKIFLHTPATRVGFASFITPTTSVTVTLSLASADVALTLVGAYSKAGEFVSDASEEEEHHYLRKCRGLRRQSRSHVVDKHIYRVGN